MKLVRQEYHHSLEMLKKIIQEKNCDEVTDDLDTIEEKDDDDKVIEEPPLLEPSVDLVQAVVEEEDLLDEQDEDAQKFQFISPEDEKQLKDLRKETRQVVLARKKSKSKLTQQQKPQQDLSSKQIAQLQKNSSRQITQDFTFNWPLELHHFWLSSLFGARKKANGKPGFHYGVDMAAMRGTPVKAAAAGTVIQAQYVPGYGNNILIQHNKYYRTRYAHLQRIHVTVGQKVAQGQKIGAVGDTGSVRKSGRDGSHLHFEIYHNGSHVNPLRYLFN
ncbi:M23 family metallopeptidase [Candidatus Babeliales bacterium]|nr:M23 family metallopeptidase [Candidatus Babeliales bacterium]MBP9843785.1 M23 family metallopeptidase [Candidatus Babeliales bacterium]